LTSAVCELDHTKNGV